MDSNSLLYHIALTQIPQIGDVQIANLLKHFLEPEAVFKVNRKQLELIPGIGSIRASEIKNFKSFEKIENEIQYARDNNITILVKGQDGYPGRLEECLDAPHVLYYKGHANLNTSKTISVIGTRSPSSYGKEHTSSLVAALAEYVPLIVSGLAYGIDTIVHRESLKNEIPTVAVLGHGFKFIYPYENRQLAAEMISNGGLLTEFMHDVKPDKQNFPKRNRIVAGIADAVVVIESGEKGGSLITADIANSYNRDVLALPGRTTDLKSIGCNQLIKNNKANLITSGKDMIKFLNWVAKSTSTKKRQLEFFVELSDHEKMIFEQINERGPISIDEITIRAGIKPSMAASIIFSLEMKNLVVALPGKCYKTLH
jgi:DNA processing protein